MVVRIVPSRLYYAAIRINPTVMVQDLGLDDSQTFAEAQGLTNKTYLVLLTMPGELPMPGMRWCRYTIEPIGTSLRNAVPESGITADMVVPIAPNTDHARGHEPVHPSSSFPFPNCYHWIDNDVVVRIRVPPCGGFEHDGAIRLSVKERSALIRKFEGDYDRIGDFVRNLQPRSCQCSEEADVQDVSDPIIGGCSTQELSEAYRRYAEEEAVMSSSPLARLLSRRSDSVSDSDRASASAAKGACSANPLDSDFVNLFGQATDPANGLIPLVDCWLDIDKHLTAETIPSPDELETEVEQVVEIIKRGIARRLLSERQARARMQSVLLHIGHHIRMIGSKQIVPFALYKMRQVWKIVGSAVLLPLTRNMWAGPLIFVHRLQHLAMVAAARHRV
ncbi:hypothetical protein K466DRAFT_269464 [Polyporus arcularius HHB13444]|uniref:Uncharacterized protein n=1 Tax=Polyporus arcularius HHB13444 TaxID=1314778 RepID=A0A5C3PS29_9APHY|nr:hypothetical protein K466DRAFT_269464 [Polyporus arcularius HHB13444]